MLNKNIVARNASRRMFPLEDFFEEFFKNPALSARADIPVMAFAPKCDIEENEKEYQLHFEVPGMSEDELNIEVKDRTLIVSGERKKKEEKNGKTYHYTESSYGHFERALSLPENVDLAKIEAKHEKGILTVIATKKEITPPQKIPITQRN